jgi:hypothetical protein
VRDRERALPAKVAVGRERLPVDMCAPVSRRGRNSRPLAKVKSSESSELASRLDGRGPWQ